MYMVKQDKAQTKQMLASKRRQLASQHKGGNKGEPHTLYQNTSLPDIHATQSNSKSSALISSKQSSALNRQVLSNKTFGSDVRNHPGSGVYQSQDLQRSGKGPTDFSLPQLTREFRVVRTKAARASAERQPPAQGSDRRAS